VERLLRGTVYGWNGLLLERLTLERLTLERLMLEQFKRRQQQQTTANNNKQQQTTTNNNKQQQTTTNNNKQQQTTTNNNKQQQTTTKATNINKSNKHATKAKKQQKQKSKTIFNSIDACGSFKLAFFFQPGVRVTHRTPQPTPRGGETWGAFFNIDPCPPLIVPPLKHRHLLFLRDSASRLSLGQLRSAENVRVTIICLASSVAAFAASLSSREFRAGSYLQ
jgi:DNA mismatch repair ATPase MutL